MNQKEILLMIYKKRIIDEILNETLSYRGGVLIEGPKWSGKTTSARQIAKSCITMTESEPTEIYLSGNYKQILQGPVPHLIDEWQLAPRIWDEVRNEIDRRSLFGQFILTGSSVSPDREKIKHTGTGRISRIIMRTMSLYESEDSSGEVSLKSLFDNPDEISGTSDIDIDRLAFLVSRGGWPGSLAMSDRYALKSAEDLYNSTVNSDIVREGKLKRDPEKVKNLMRSYARNQGSQASNGVLAGDIVSGQSVDPDTVASYVNALENIFVVENMPAWNPNLRSRTAVRTSPTRYYSDSSFAVQALGTGPEGLIKDLRTFGFIFEAMCIRDLRIYSEALDGSVYHYRDKSNLECDAVIVLRDGRYGLIEIKLGGEERIEEGAESLKKLREKIDTDTMNTPSFLMVLTGTTKYAYRRRDGVYVVPAGCLKN